MKFSTALVAQLAVEASHFRAISYNIIQGDTSSEVKISRTHAWRQMSDGYSGGCQATHVQNQTPSGNMGAESCNLLNGGTCGSAEGNYIVTDIENTLVSSNNYCYGYEQDTFAKPSGPYSMQWGGCCWVAFTADSGAGVSGGSFGFRAIVNDPDNNTPQVKIPPVWKILAGCPAQTLALNPIDLDNDSVKCRFATSAEGQGASNESGNFNSITLDETTCILTYDGSLDQATGGVKPIAIQVEDFDADGNIKSSIPVQFLATVWTPSNSNFNQRQLGMHGAGNPVEMPELFPIDDDEDTDMVGRKRRQASNPAYCNMLPVLDTPSPSAGAVINVPAEGVDITLTASSTNGAITRFTYSSPIGMNCGAVDLSGSVKCNFVPTAAQMSQAHNFCFMAEDAAGMSTERRCITLAAGVTITNPTTKTEVTEIFSLIKHSIPSMEGDFENYGCAGVGNMDAGAKTLGKPVDAVDKALNVRKHCIKCAEADFGNYTTYDFDEDNNACDNNIDTAERAFCECDVQFATSVDGLETDNKNYNTNKCVPFMNNQYNGMCCKAPNTLYTSYSSNYFVCCSGDVKPIGSC